MIIPDTEEILFKNQNELKKGCFYKQGFIISLVPFGLICTLYIFMQFISPFVYFPIMLVIYIIVSLVTSKSMYKNYNRYFGSDELAYSKTTLYYNICMNINGRYTNYDDHRDINDISEIYIRKGWNPSSLVIYFKDGDHIAIHSLKDIEDVKKRLSNL